MQVLPHLRRRLRRPLHLLRPRALGRIPLPEATDRHEEHHVPELHHPGRHGRVAGAHRHGNHQRHRQVHIQEHRHLLRHPRHGRPIHARVLTAQPRSRRPEEVLPGAEQPPHGERERDREQGAALRQRAHDHGAARRREGRHRRQGGARAHDAPDDATIQGVRAGRAREAPLHQECGVQGGHGPGQAQQGHFIGEGVPVLMNKISGQIRWLSYFFSLFSFSPHVHAFSPHVSPLSLSLSLFCVSKYMFTTTLCIIAGHGCDCDGPTTNSLFL